MTDLRILDSDEDGRNDLWAAEEPNNYKGKEDCVVFQDGELNDAKCDQRGGRSFDGVMCAFIITTTTFATTTTTPMPVTTTTVTTTTFVTTTTTAAPSTTTTEWSTTTTVWSSTTTVAPTTTTTVEPTTTTTRRYTRPVAAVESKYVYYKFFDELMTWTGSRTACQNDGGFLAPVLDFDANEAIWDEAQNRGFGPYWIGGLNIATSRGNGNEGDFIWVDGSSYVFGDGLDADGDNRMDVWMKNEPNNYLDEEACVRVGTVGQLWKRAQWNDARCDDSKERNPYVCAYEVTTTSAAPTSTTTEVPSTTTTEAPSTTTTEGPTTTPYQGPDNWQFFDESGCWYNLFSDKQNYAAAQASCAAFPGGSFLASPQTIAESKFVASLEENQGKPRWVAGKWSDSRQLWEGVQSGGAGYPVRPEEIGFYDGEPNDIYDRTNEDWCLQQSITPRRKDVTMWKFNDQRCSEELRYVCQHCQATSPTTTTSWMTSTTTVVTTTTTIVTTTTTVVTTTTTAEPTSTTTPEPTTAPWTTPVGWEFFEETQCHYKYSGHDVVGTFQEAASACDAAFDGGTTEIASRLASVPTMSTAMFIADLTFSDKVKDGKARWVAAMINQTTGEAGSIYDDAYFTTDSWYAGEPSGNGECVQQGYSQKNADHSRWKFNDNFCGDQNGYVCEWCGPAAPTTTTSTEAASTTTTTEGPSPCTIAPGQLNFAPTATVDAMIKRIHTMGQFTSEYRGQHNGRVQKARQTCEAVCKRETWGLGCAPCPMDYFGDADSCFAPGPFGTGELCRTWTKRGTKSFLTPLAPCCERNTDGQTCGVPLDFKCDCSLYADIPPLFNIARDWDGERCTEAGVVSK
jgi:hypothetical protein